MRNCFISQLPDAQKCGTDTFSSLRRLNSVELSHAPASGGSYVWNCRIVQLPGPQKCGTVTVSSVRRLRSVELLHFPASGSWGQGATVPAADRRRTGKDPAALRTRPGRPH